MTNARRVVLIAYFFPPTGGVSVARLLRPAEYLPRYGWEPIVVAPTSSGHPIQDPTGMAGIPSDLIVIRTACPEPAKLRRLVRSRIDRRSTSGWTPALAGRTAPLDTGWPRRASSRMSSLVRRLSFPDEQIGWLPFAVAAAVRAARRGQADAILSTSSPVTAHFAAMLASRVSGIPWVADFRDPWVGNAFDHDVPRVTAALGRYVERQLIASAAEATFATPSMTKMYQTRYPAYAHRMHTIANGYDRRERVDPVDRDPSHFTLVWAGSLGWPSELEIFLGGLRLAAQRDPGLKSRLRVRFVGYADSECDALLNDAIASPELKSIIEVVGPVSRRTALGHVQASDAALLLLPSGPGSEINVSGKIYDYIGRDRQVLAVIPDGDAAQILRDLDWGVIAAPTSDDVARGIREIMAARTTRTVADPEGRFDWVNLSALFAAALDRVAGTRVRQRRSGARRASRSEG